ncbi:MAG: hypothetical protein H7Y88_13740 [Phycisphaerales bacterium]|nr:hypothetical protein [Phycisphaerales bacterium]
MRFSLAMLLFGTTFAYVMERHRWDISMRAFEIGKRAGCAYFQSGVIAVGNSGPFFGNDVVTAACNFAWRRGPDLAAAGAGMMAFAGAWWLLPWARCHGRMGPRRGVRDGVTRCGRCQYALSGLREPMCPECGHRI